MLISYSQSPLGLKSVYRRILDLVVRTFLAFFHTWMEEVLFVGISFPQVRFTSKHFITCMTLSRGFSTKVWDVREGTFPERSLLALALLSQEGLGSHL